MFKKLTFCLLALVLTLAMGSCTTINKTAQTAPIETVVIQYPTVADLEVSPRKVSRSTSWNSFLSTMSTNTRRDNLTAELLLEADADVLVEPQYILRKNFFSTNNLTVSGFPAKLKNFRKATPDDLKAIEAGDNSIMRVDRIKKDKKKKKHKKFLFF